MRRPGIDGGFILCYVLNLVFNAYWAIPAVVLFVAHFVAGIPIWPAWVALALWLLITLGITAFMSWATSGTGTTDRSVKVTTHYSSQRHDDEK